LAVNLPRIMAMQAHWRDSIAASDLRAHLAGSVGRIERTTSPRMPPYGGV
jgi:hypothetical protein